MSKVIAIIEKPKNCQSCVFGICKYSLPLSEHIKGYYCQLLLPQQRVVQAFEYDADVHLDNCPLRPMPEKKDTICYENDNWYTVEEKTKNEGWNACIDALGGKVNE